MKERLLLLLPAAAKAIKRFETWLQAAGRQASKQVNECLRGWNNLQEPSHDLHEPDKGCCSSDTIHSYNNFSSLLLLK